MNSLARLISILSIILVGTVISLVAGEQPGTKAFVSAWEDRPVVLKRTLYSIVFDERTRFMPFVKREGRVSGLTVATTSGMYYRFDARRDSEEDVVDRDPNRVVSMLRKQYYRSLHLDEGNVQDVEPLMLVRYEPGVKLVVKEVQIARDRVRLMFHKDLGRHRVMSSEQL